MDQRFHMTTAHIRALQRLVFIHCAAEPEQDLAACLLSDPLTIFAGRNPGATVAAWMGLKPPYDLQTKRRVVEFYLSLPRALSIALQQATCPPKAQKIQARGSLAMLLGYGGDASSDAQARLPQLDSEATQIALTLAQDPEARFASLAPLIEGIQNPSYYFLPTQSHLGFLQTLRFGWNGFEGADGMPNESLDEAGHMNALIADLADTFFIEPRDITLVEYLSCVPTMAAELPQVANEEAGHQRLLAELEPALSYFLASPRIQPGAYYRCRQTRGFWRPEAPQTADELPLAANAPALAPAH